MATNYEINKKIAEIQLRGNMDDLVAKYIKVFLKKIKENREEQKFSYRTLEYITSIGHNNFARADNFLKEESAELMNVNMRYCIAYALATDTDVESIFIDDENRFNVIKRNISRLSITDKQELLAALMEDLPEYFEAAGSCNDKISHKFYSNTYFVNVFWSKKVALYNKAKDITETFSSIEEKIRKVEELLNEQDNNIFYTSYEELYEIKYVVSGSIVKVYFTDGVEQAKKTITMIQFFEGLVNYDIKQ